MSTASIYYILLLTVSSSALIDKLIVCGISLVILISQLRVLVLFPKYAVEFVRASTVGGRLIHVHGEGKRRSTKSISRRNMGQIDYIYIYQSISIFQTVNRFQLRYFIQMMLNDDRL